MFADVSQGFLLPFSGPKRKLGKQAEHICDDPEDGGSTLLWNDGTLVPDYIA
jgi:hypothetical protein